MLVTTTFPLAEPAIVGAKFTVIVFVPPAAIEKGVATLVSEKPLPAIETPETEIAVVPVFVRVTLKDDELFTLTLPKLKDVGDAVMAPLVTEVPVPLRGMDKLGFVASLVTTIEPLAEPVAVGAKVTVKLVLAPEASVRGVLTAD